LTVALVLRSGGDFTVEHVARLVEGVARHWPQGHELQFTILTDMSGPVLDAMMYADFDAGFRVVDLSHDWPGWWSKIEMFRPGLFDGPVLYLDLDTVIVGDLSDVASYRGAFAMVSDFYSPHRLASGLMSWSPSRETERIYGEFADAPQVWADWAGRGGDQVYIGHVLGDVDRWQKLVPGQIVSWKADCGDGVPEDARVVCFHGKPRPWETDLWAA